MDIALLLMAIGAFIFLLGEGLALLVPGMGETASARLRRALGRSWWRRAALAAGLALLFTHIAYGWPW